MATPKKNVEKTIMSAVDAVAYLDWREPYIIKGSVKKKAEPIKWEWMLTLEVSRVR